MIDSRAYSNRKKIANIIRGVVRGELEHCQTTYHCGTAHCIAGWYTYSQKEDRGWRMLTDLISEFLSDGNSIINDFLITQYECDLTTDQARDIFAVHLTIDQIVENWNNINKGYPELQVK